MALLHNVRSYGLGFDNVVSTATDDVKAILFGNESGISAIEVSVLSDSGLGSSMRRSVRR